MHETGWKSKLVYGVQTTLSKEQKVYRLNIYLETLLRGPNRRSWPAGPPNCASRCGSVLLLVPPCRAPALYVSRPRHTWFKWSGCDQASAGLDEELIWIGCVGVWRHGKHAGTGRHQDRDRKTPSDRVKSTNTKVQEEVMTLFKMWGEY